MSRVVNAFELNGSHVGGTLFDENRTRSYWTNLKDDAVLAWSKRLTDESQFVTVPDPQWVEITMVTHKKNGQVLVRTIIPGEGYLSERNHKFNPLDSVRVAAPVDP